jgi:hypothetical protein
MMSERQRPQSRAMLAVSVALAVALAGIGTIGWRWYSYVTAGESAYDEVGRIKERFPRAVPPYGCQPGQV